MWNSFPSTKGTMLIKSIKVTASMGIDHPKTQKTLKPRTKITLSRWIFVHVSLLALLYQRNFTPHYYMNLLKAHHHWVTEFLWNCFVKELWKKLSMRATRVFMPEDNRKYSCCAWQRVVELVYEMHERINRDRHYLGGDYVLFEIFYYSTFKKFMNF